MHSTSKSNPAIIDYFSNNIHTYFFFYFFAEDVVHYHKIKTEHHSLCAPAIMKGSQMSQIAQSHHNTLYIHKQTYTLTFYLNVISPAFHWQSFNVIWVLPVSILFIWYCKAETHLACDNLVKFIFLGGKINSSKGIKCWVAATIFCVLFWPDQYPAASNVGIWDTVKITIIFLQ